MEDSSPKEDNPGVLKLLEALKQAIQELQAHPTHKSVQSNSSPIKALLELETESFLTRRVSTYSISRVAGSIESEIQALMDRGSIDSLINALKDPWKDEDELARLLSQFEHRVSQGFNPELQDSVLKSKAFSVLQTVLCDPNCSKQIREKAAFCVAALIRFNKDVFVGQVNMGDTIQALLEMKSAHSVKVLCELITFIKSPFVDVILCNGELPKILTLLESKDLSMKVVVFNCILEIGYFGRKEAVEAMLNGGLIEKLVELQRSEFGENHPFASCVARFAVQLEVGEGLRKREKRAFKPEILEKVREASVNDAEAATIIAEVLWGSSP
ncbi:hypothetical protein GOBAR_AA34319 [Gossypium barbadense]|uniref:Nucleotide exchange factor Fes1 domain-containing protein n=1 Tax=Gossypium barbadense TaxID=3634 RepID=A0A2P5W5M8_GOSBA|nr:hypothetical protein GOBAR_AA34319 [Gossypium barbadense]